MNRGEGTGGVERREAFWRARCQAVSQFGIEYAGETAFAWAARLERAATLQCTQRL